MSSAAVGSTLSFITAKLTVAAEQNKTYCCQLQSKTEVLEPTLGDETRKSKAPELISYLS